MALVYFDDRFVDESEARVSVTTHALHYGTAVFEGIRAYGDGTRSAIFRPEDHYRRLLDNAAWLQMAPRQSAAELTSVTVELLRRNRFLDDRYIRPILYKSAQTIGAGLPPGEALAIVTTPMTRGALPRAGVTATWSKWRRFPAAACPAGAKITGLYVNSSLARADSLARGFDQPIVLNMAGDVAEGYGANIVAVFGNRMITPPLDADILNGITRDTLIRYAASQADLEVTVQTLSTDALVRASEVFLCGTGLEILPIVRIEGQPIGDGSGGGPVTRRLAAWYQDVVTGVAPPLAADWLVPVVD